MDSFINSVVLKVVLSLPGYPPYRYSIPGTNPGGIACD